jgi:hypothetical protein
LAEHDSSARSNKALADKRKMGNRRFIWALDDRFPFAVGSPQKNS